MYAFSEFTAALPPSRSLQPGDRVVVDKDKVGQILWAGTSRRLGVGRFYGIRLTHKRGTNDGCYKGKRFFQCPVGCGLIVRRKRIKKLYIGEEFDFLEELEECDSDEEESTTVSMADGSCVSGALAKLPKKACFVLIVERDVAAEHIYLLCAFWFRSESPDGSGADAARRIPYDIVTLVRKFLRKVIMGRPSLELKQAFEDGYADVPRMLHAQGVDIVSAKAPSPDCTALEYACEMGHCEVIDVLISAGADPRGTKSSDGITPLMLASSSGCILVVKKLLAFGCDIHAKSPFGTALFCASHFGNTELVKLFVELGADLETRSSQMSGMTPLLGAVSKGHLQTVEYLVSVGADIDAESECHTTCLMYAAAANSIPLMKYFMTTHGCDITKKNVDGNDAFAFAVIAGNLEAAQFIVEHSGDVDLEMEMFYRVDDFGSFKDIEVLLALGANVNAMYDGGRTLLMFAAASGRLDIVKLLLRHGADVLAIDENKDDALAYAAKEGHFGVVDFLQVEMAKALSVKEAGELSVAESKVEALSECPD